MARRVDEKVVEEFLSTIVPSELELSLAVVAEIGRQSDEVNKQWKLRLERARYEVARAERQYQAVEPENRIVARTLETRWNQKLQELQQIERELEEAKSAQRLVLTDEDKDTIRRLAADLPKVFHASTTTAVERKQLLRLLIADIVLTPIDAPQRVTQIRILWKTGAQSELTALRPSSVEQCKTSAEVVALVRELVAKGQSNAQIAAELASRNWKSGKGHPFTESMLRNLRHGYGIRSPLPREPDGRRAPTPYRDGSGRYSVTGLAAHYQVSPHVVRYWISRCIVTPKRDYPGGPFWFELTDDAHNRIAEALQRGYTARRRKPQHSTFQSTSEQEAY